MLLILKVLVNTKVKVIIKKIKAELKKGVMKKRGSKYAVIKNNKNIMTSIDVV